MNMKARRLYGIINLNHTKMLIYQLPYAILQVIKSNLRNNIE